MKIKTMLRAAASAAIAAAVTATAAISASADTIDFENGQFESYFEIKDYDGGSTGTLSVVDFNGSKQLKFDVDDCSLISKVTIYLDRLVGSDHLEDIAKVQLDVTIASKDGTTPPGWTGGDLGSESLDGQVTLPWSDSSWSGGEYENAVAEPVLVEHKWLLPTNKPKNGTTDITCLLQRWATEVPYDLYIDNVKLLDKDGNVLATALDGAAAPAAPASDTPATTSTSTGNASAAAIAAVMACAAAAAFAARKRTK